MSISSNHRRPRDRTTLDRYRYFLPLAFPLTALPFASVHNIALATIGITLSLMAAIGLRSPSIMKRIHSKTATLFLVASIPLWLTLLQLWPMAEGLRTFLQPGYEPLAIQSLNLSDGGMRPLSLHPRQTLIELCFGIGILALAALSAVVFNSHQRARRAAEVLVVSAAAIAVLGIVQNATGSNQILWFFSSEEWKESFATFINNNHGAVTISACAPLGIYLTYRSRGQQELLVWGALTATIVIGALTSGSRSGAIVLAASCLVYALAQSSKSVQRAGLVLAIPTAALVLYFGVEDSFQELTLLVDTDFYLPQSLDTGRMDIYRASLPLIWSAPLIGAGAGAFSEAFKSRHLVEIGATVQQAHSDPIEAVIEYGFPAASLWFLVICYVFGHIAYRCRKKNDSASQHTTAAYLATAFGIALHSLWDFPFRVGTMAILFALALGCAWGLTLHKSKVVSTRLALATQWVMTALAIVSVGLGGMALVQTNNSNSRYGAVDRTLEQANTAKEAGHAEDAARLYRAALRQKPFEHRALFGLALLDVERGQPEAALQVLGVASRIYSDHHYIWLNLARIERSSGRSLKAAQHYRTLLGLRSPSKESADAWLSEALSNHPSPHTVADIILPLRPDRWCQAARVLTREHSQEAGEQMYKLAAELDPDCGYAHAAQLLQWGRPQEAMDLLSALPESCSKLRVRGFAQLALKQNSDAAATLQQANIQCSLAPYGRYQLALAKLESGDQTGLRILRQLVIDHDEVYVRRALMFRAENSGATEEATKHLNVLLERDQIAPQDISEQLFPRLRHTATKYGSL